MASNFNEIDMMVLAKLSYYKVPGGQYRSDGTAIEPYSLDDMMRNSKIDKAMRKEFGNTTIDNFLKKIDAQDYKIVKAIDNTYESGFEGIAIEGPDSKTVTVATRGSESHNLEDVAQDWVGGDVVGLGIMAESHQQDDMNDFMEDLDQYDSIYLTGHSLGGNLAVSGAVNFDNPDKIKAVYTYNAPGQNATYITTHASGISNVSYKITNYQNEDDWVSDINIPIGNVVYIKSNHNGMNAHSLGNYDGYSNGSFSTTNNKHLGHYATSLGVNLLTTGMSEFALIAGVGGLYVADEVGKTIKKVIDFCGEKVKSTGDWIGEAYSDAKSFVKDSLIRANNIVEGGIKSMWNDELKFDIDKLRETKAKCDEIKLSLTEKKTNLINQLEDLRKDWQTDAGKAFFEDQNTDWTAQVDNYVKITEAISKLLDVAITQYENVVSEAKRLNI